LDEVAELVGGTLIGNPAVEVAGVAGLSEAGPNDLTFLADRKYLKQVAASSAAAVLAVSRENISKPVIEVANPYAAFAELLEVFYPSAPPSGTVDERAALAPDVSLGEGVTIHPYAVLSSGVVVGDRTVIGAHTVIGEGCAVGADCILYAQVTLYRGVTIGDRVIVHSGSVLGSDGFGYAQLEDGAQRKIPQVGRVVVEDDVEIGANVTVDRATLGKTIIGRGTKIDNLVHIAHNNTIGSDGIVAAQAGLSGSCEVGDRVIIAGQVGLVDHVRVGDGAVLIAQSGVTSDVEPGTIVSGSPAIPHATWRRMIVVTPKLPELSRTVRSLEKRLKALESKLGEDINE
jgi:UDP-3-O-[3-hydroxymyristoyl] glucosamine N-acyltransferase